MKTFKLMATKAHRYGTRHLTAGDEYEVPIREAVALVATKKAKFAAKPKRLRPAAPVAAPQPQSEPEPQPEPHVVPAMNTNSVMQRLQEEAGRLGIDVDGRWGVARLQHEIAQAKR